MTIEHPEPPESAVELALKLMQSTVERGMEYEEFTFTIQDGELDGLEYKVVVMMI